MSQVTVNVSFLIASGETKPELVSARTFLERCCDVSHNNGLEMVLLGLRGKQGQGLGGVGTLSFRLQCFSGDQLQRVPSHTGFF